MCPTSRTLPSTSVLTSSGCPCPKGSRTPSRPGSRARSSPARLTTHTHEALCGQETRPHRMSERFVGDGRPRLTGRKDARASSGYYLVDRPQVPWRTPFAMTPHVDTARKASPGTGQWARFPSSEATQEVTSVRIQKLDPLSGAFANTPVTEGNPLQPVTAYYKTAPPTRCALPAGSRRRRQSAGGPATAWNRARRAPPPGPDRFRSPSMVSMHLIPVRRHGTPETPLVSDLVRTHTSHRHASGPQAELAGH